MTRSGTDNGQHVLIVEDDHHGHRLSYVALLARHAISNGSGVTLAVSAEAQASAEWTEHLSNLPKSVAVSVLERESPKQITALARAIGATSVVVPDGDHLAKAIARHGWPLRRPLTVLIMRPQAQPTGQRVRDSLRIGTKRLLITWVAMVPHVKVRRLQSSLAPARRGWVRDPVRIVRDDGACEKLREQMSVSGPRTWLGVVGAITDRKNVSLILRALIGTGSQLGLVIAGRVDPLVRDEIEQLVADYRADGGVVLMMDRTLSDEELDAAVIVVDAVILAHSNEGPSGILAKAAAAGTYVLASGAESLRRDVALLGADASWCPLTVSDLRTSLTLVRQGRERSSGSASLATEEDFARGLLD